MGDKYSPGSRRNRSQVHGGSKLDHHNISRSATSAGGPGITYERSYTVHYQDADASSQVQLKDLDAKGFEVASNISEISV